MHSFIGNVAHGWMVRDYKSAEVLWEMSSLAAPESGGSETGMPEKLQVCNSLFKTMKPLEAQLKGFSLCHRFHLLRTLTVFMWFNEVPKQRLFFFSFWLCLFHQFPFLLITKHKYITYIFTFYFHLVTVYVFAKIKVWIHPLTSSCCFPACFKIWTPQPL